MTSCISAQWVNTAPQIKMTVDFISETENSATYDWVLYYVATSAASTSVAKSYSATIDGNVVASGTKVINGLTGTHTLKSGRITIAKKTSSRSISFGCSMAMNLTWSGVYKGTVSASGSFNIRGITTYTVSFNANGGTGAPSSQTKTYGVNLTLPSAKPTRTGYTFLGWSTSSTATTATWSAGGVYSTNATDILYAVWKAHTYTVSFNANGGTGAPSSQTKTYGKNLTLSSTKPTKTNYNFLGWSTSSTATTATWSAGGVYSINASDTLYAVWELAYVKPRITGFKVTRCDADKNPTDSGKYAQIKFSYECDRDVTGIDISWASTAGNGSTSVSASGISGSVSVAIGAGMLNPEVAYTITLTVSDSIGSSTLTRTLAGQYFPIDCKSGGKGVSIGKAAELDNVFDVALNNLFRGTTTQLGNRYAFSSPGIAGTAGYIFMAQIEITAANADTPITFVLTRRTAQTPMTVYLRFSNSTATASSLSSIRYEGSNYGVFACKAGELVWHLYVQKVSAYDTVTIQDWYTSSTMNSRISVTFPGTLVSTVPTPYYRATPAVLESIIDFIFPVGKIEIFYNHDDPNVLYPGSTWVRIENAFLWGTTASGTIGQTGGESTVALTTANMPSHRHAVQIANTATGSLTASNLIRYNNSNSSYVGTAHTDYSGSGEAHNNMPPYIQVSIWRRTG